MHPFYENNPDSVRFFAADCEVFPEHLHSQVEITYLYGGEASMTINRSEYALTAGDMAICFSGVAHGYSQSNGVDGMTIVFSPAISTDFSVDLARCIPVCPVLRSKEITPDTHKCMEAIADECRAGRDERVLRGYLQVVLARTIPRLTLVSQPSESPDITYRILQYLALHFTEPISLPELSKALGVSESHLSHTFSRRLRTSFRAYINALRLNQACTLLSSGEDSITRILYECGFESPRTFNRAFLEQYGMTPSEYRSSHRSPKG